MQVCHFSYSFLPTQIQDNCKEQTQLSKKIVSIRLGQPVASAGVGNSSSKCRPEFSVLWWDLWWGYDKTTEFLACVTLMLGYGSPCPSTASLQHFYSDWRAYTACARDENMSCHNLLLARMLEGSWLQFFCSKQSDWDESQRETAVL